jgi:hypothetical protein
VTDELGYLGDFPKWGASLDVRAYREKITGFLRQKTTTGRPRNYAKEMQINSAFDLTLA